jgi:hypothetical protein
MAVEYPVTEYVPKRKVRIGYGNSDFRIRFITDTHQDAECFRKDLFHTFVKAQEKDENSVWIHGGDLMDSDRPTTRHMKKIMYADRHEAWTVDDKKTFREIDATIIPLYKKIASSCAGLLEGDHYHVFSNGMTSTEYIAKRLKVPYLGERSSFVALTFYSDNVTSFQYVIHVRHGRGGVGTHGGDINALVKQEAAYLADLHLGGHSHKSNIHTERMEYVSVQGIKKSKLITYMRGGSFLEGFPGDGKKTYAMRKEYSPLPCGWGELELSIGREFRGVSKARPFIIRQTKASIISG